MYNHTRDCPFWPHIPSRCELIKTLLIVSTIFSITGCLFIIFIIILFKQHKSFVQRFVLLLTFCACLKSIFLLIPTVEKKKGLCQTEAFFIQFLSWAELLWICSISINIVLSLLHKSTARNEKYFHLFVWLVSLFWAIIPILSNEYGPAGFWCWIERDASAMRFGTWYIPMFLLIFVIVGIYCYILYLAFCTSRYKSYDTSEFEDESARSSLQEEVKPLLAYPIIYLILSIPLTAYRIQDATFPNENPDYVLLILSVISSPLLGLFNAIAFSCFQDTFKLLTCSYLSSFCTLCCGQENVRITHNYQGVDNADAASQALLRGDDGNQHEEYGIHPKEITA